jgi:hypothetical protein
MGKVLCLKTGSRVGWLVQWCLALVGVLSPGPISTTSYWSHQDMGHTQATGYLTAIRVICPDRLLKVLAPITIYISKVFVKIKIFQVSINFT